MVSLERWEGKWKLQRGGGDGDGDGNTYKLEEESGGACMAARRCVGPIHYEPIGRVG